MQTSSGVAVIILAIALAYLVCRLITGRLKLTSRAYLRGKDQMLREQIAISLEESAPIHLDVAGGGDGSLAGGAVLAAAEATETVSAQMAFADEPWMITGSGGLTTSVEKDAVRSGMEAADYGSFYDADCAVFTGTAPISHEAGNLTSLEMTPSVLHLSVGSFGASSALNDPLCSQGEMLCVGGDDLLSQAIGTVTADAVFVGEQFAEIPDSMDRKEKKNPALFAMDVMRWVVIAAIVIFAVAGLSGM